MREPEHLRLTAEAAEATAAATALALTDGLMRPTNDRAGVAERLATLSVQRDAVGHLVLQMRRLVGPPALHDRRPARGTIATPQYLRDLRLRLPLWDRAMAAVAICAAGWEWPLMPDSRPPFDLGQGQDRAIANVLTRATYAVTTPAQSADAVDLGCYPDIPLNAARFMCNIHLAHRMTLARKQRAPVRFIDVGCGSGLKVALAAQVFGQADGLDYDAGYAAAATRILAAMGAAHSRVFQADAMTFDGYAGYEVIYFYEPMYEPGLMTLEARVIGAARPGTIVIAPSQRFIQRAAGLGLVRINDAVYLKGEPSDGVEALIAETRRMGPHFVGPDHGLPPEATWVAPLWHACLANGIDPDQTPVGSANGDSG